MSKSFHLYPELISIRARGFSFEEKFFFEGIASVQAAESSVAIASGPKSPSATETTRGEE